MVDGTVAEGRRDFYVYVIFRPNGIPCYVGKGRGERWKRPPRHRNNRHLARIASGGDLPVVVIREGLAEPAAFEIEKTFIAAIGREAKGGPLVNATDGGEGPAGFIFPRDVIERRSEKNRGRKHTQENKDRISAAKLGMSRPDLKGKAQTPDLIERRIAPQRGKKRKPLSEATRAKMSLIRRGRKVGPYSPSRIAAAAAGVSRALKGKPKTEAHKAAMRKPKSQAHREKLRIVLMKANAARLAKQKSRDVSMSAQLSLSFGG